MIILQADNDSFGGKLLFAGLPNAMALVLLIWIYFFTLNHEDEEQKLKSLLVEIVTNVGGGGEINAAGDTATEESAFVPPADEPEF